VKRCKNCCKYLNCKNVGKSNCDGYVADERLFYFNFSRPRPLKPTISHGETDNSESTCEKVDPLFAVIIIMACLFIILTVVLSI